MSELFGTKPDREATPDPNTLENYIPLELVDREKYEVLHPEEATRMLGMVSRTIYKKITQGELLFTTEKGAKRVLVEKAVTHPADRSEPIPDRSERSEKRPEIDPNPASMDPTRHRSDSEHLSDLVGRVLTLSERLADKDQMIQERDQTILTLNNQLQNAHTALQKRNLPEVLDPRQKEIEELKSRLDTQTKLIESMLQRKPWWKFW
jgi:hypothetical protein